MKLVNQIRLNLKYIQELIQEYIFLIIFFLGVILFLSVYKYGQFEFKASVTDIINLSVGAYIIWIINKKEKIKNNLESHGIEIITNIFEKLESFILGIHSLDFNNLDNALISKIFLEINIIDNYVKSLLIVLEEVKKTDELNDLKLKYLLFRKSVTDDIVVHDFNKEGYKEKVYSSYFSLDSSIHQIQFKIKSN